MQKLLREETLILKMVKKIKPSIKIGTKLEALWTDVERETKRRIEDLEKELIINKSVLELAKNKILLEQRK